MGKERNEMIKQGYVLFKKLELVVNAPATANIKPINLELQCSVVTQFMLILLCFV